MANETYGYRTFRQNPSQLSLFPNRSPFACNSEPGSPFPFVRLPLDSPS